MRQIKTYIDSTSTIPTFIGDPTEEIKRRFLSKIDYKPDAILSSDSWDTLGWIRDDKGNYSSIHTLKELEEMAMEMADASCRKLVEILKLAKNPLLIVTKSALKRVQRIVKDFEFKVIGGNSFYTA